LAAIILIGILVYPSSPLLGLFANKNSEVVLPFNSNGKQSVTLGALLPLSGASSSLGESEDAAIKIAIKDVNEYFPNATQTLELSSSLRIRKQTRQLALKSSRTWQQKV
jgi:hypothetical protein